MDRPTRRQVLAALASGAAAGLAGCAVKTCNGGETTPTAVHAPAADPAPGAPRAGGDWPMHGRDPGNTWALPGDALRSAEVGHRFTVSLPVEAASTSEGSAGTTSRTGAATGTATARQGGNETDAATTSPTPGRRTRRLWPVAVDDRLYVADEAGAVRALAAGDGSEVWVSEVAPTHPPAVGARAVYAADDAELVALDRADGSVRWRYTRGSRFGTPVVADGAVFVTGRERLHAVDLDGSRRWLAPTGDAPARPAVEDAGVYVASDRGGTVTARDPASGERLWRRAGDLGYLGDPDFGEYAGTRPPAVRGGTVYVPQGHAVVALAADDGAGEWTWETNGNDYLSTAAVTADRVYVAAFYRPSGAGKFDTMFALPADGDEPAWCRAVPGASLATTPVAGAGRALVRFRAARGHPERLVLFDGETGDTPWVFQGYDGRAVSPVVAGGALYLGTDAGTLYGLTLE